ncbi:MAG: YHS domain-containing (seleno)protein [Phormidesmis sp.]
MNIYKGQDKRQGFSQRPRLQLVLIPIASLVLGLAACAPTTTADTAADTATNTSAETATSADPAETETAPATTKTYVEDGVAIQGADPVAYFTQSAYVPGSAEYTYDWNGVTWQFASAENRDQFASAPEEYAPQYGGFCAWAVAAKNVLVAVDPNAWSVVDDKLYLNANKKVQSTWQKDQPGFIVQANENWPTLSQ